MMDASPVFRICGFLTGLLVMALALAGCERTPPVSTGDGPRLVIINPALARMAVVLGGEAFIVGRHGADSWLDPDLPVAATFGEIDDEVLARLHPTDVFLQAGAEGIPSHLQETASRFGFTVHALPLLTLADTRAALAAVDDVLHPEPGLSPAATRELEAMETAWQPHPELAAAAGRTLILAWTDPPGVMGPGSFHYQMLEAMGFDLIPAAGAPYIEWSAERVVREAPECIVLMLPGADAGAGDNLLGPLRGGGMPAEVNGHVIVITAPDCHLPGPPLVDVAREVVRQAEAWGGS
ncbi:MAG: hypothetical protein KDA21_13915 [Phycisphaerales bacterium]|nr:hypothetical protein [Phycisphaerales bacterium]